MEKRGFTADLQAAIEGAARTLINEMAEKKPDDEWRKNLEALIRVRRALGSDDEPEKIDADGAFRSILGQIEGTGRKLKGDEG